MDKNLLLGEANSFLTDWHRAAAEADAEKYFGSMDNDFVFLGTDLQERWTKEEFKAWAMPYFRGNSAWFYSAIKRDITISDSNVYAWFDELLESEKYWTCRGTGVMFYSANGWKLKHYSLSFTIPNEVVAEITPIIKSALSNKGE